MPAPTYTRPIQGTAPDQFVQNSLDEAAINAALAALWDALLAGSTEEQIQEVLDAAIAAQASQVSAAASSAAAGSASGRLDIGSFDELATKFTYGTPGAGQQQVAAGDVILWRGTGLALDVLASGATGGRVIDCTATGGIKAQFSQSSRPGRGNDLHQWGRENLVRWLEGLRTFETLKVAMVGDSNTLGFVGSTLATYLNSLPNVSVNNFGVSGSNIEQWRTGTGGFAGSGKELSDVIAYDPDLIVMCWGTNDPLSSRDLEDFTASLSAAMTTLRAALDVNACSVAILTPNAMSSANGQNEAWSHQLRLAIQEAAEQYVCAFYDKNALFPNSTVDAAAGAMQNKFWDSARVHTTALSGNILAAAIAEWLAPRSLWAMTWDNIPTKAAADLASTYPPGVSIARMSDGPLDGFVATMNPISSAGHFPIQWNWASAGPDARFAHRVAISGVWRSWLISGPDPLQVVTSLAAGYALAGGAAGLNTQRDGNLVSLSGRLTLSTPGQVIAQQVGAISTVSHRPIFNIQDAEAVCINAGGTVERLRADVSSNGGITVRETSVMTDCTTVSINVVYRGA